MDKLIPNRRYRTRCGRIIKLQKNEFPDGWLIAYIGSEIIPYYYNPNSEEGYRVISGFDHSYDIIERVK